ncbi:MAG: hypothetical protein SFU91_13340 [Chloroherpetonaceae bacterium]|nr:hypothetical protein [Chloroherpetonaceae bacterium]
MFGGGIEITRQLITDGEVSNWSSVTGSAVQGAITGGAAGLTGGASLFVTASVAGGANAIGGALNRGIQGQETTVSDVVQDATVGAVLGGAGKALSGGVKGALDDASNQVKGKVGEIATEVKYLAKGYISQGKDKILTGTKTATGKPAAAVFDHKMKSFINGQTKTVESKFNSAGLTKNQKLAMKKNEVSVDRTSSADVGNAAMATGVGTAAGVDSQRQKK